MTSRFSDQLVARTPGSAPTFAPTLLRELGVAAATQPAQAAAVQAWLDQGHEVSSLLALGLERRGLPTTRRRAA